MSFPPAFWRLALLCGLALAARPSHAAKDALGQEPSKAVPDLVVHPQGTDLSAYRLDCEVFGWNRAFTQVAAVGTELYRGPRGKHRGEAFLLAYEVGKTVPIYNVIAHNITHADLPNDPIPLDDARDLMWVIENSYLGMWPKRPQHKRPQGAMLVDTLVEPHGENGLCTPQVGFALELQGKHRFQPFVPMDMKVSCAQLKQTDNRIYWGKKDVAATMLRFDFSPLESNEKSARFVVSAAWSLARELNVVIESGASLPREADKELRRRLGKLGKLRVRKVMHEQQYDNTQPIILWVAAKDPLLAQYLGHALETKVAPLEDSHADVVVHLGYGSPYTPPEPALPPAPEAPPPTPGQNPNDDPDAQARAAEHMTAIEPSAMPDDVAPAAKPVAPPQPTSYIKDWQVP